VEGNGIDGKLILKKIINERRMMDGTDGRGNVLSEIC
jgi:hypothetical protein